VGLGSGTQLALAVGVGLARLYGLPMSAREIARLTERGARSGVGLAVFEQGGFALDGGRGQHDDAPPVIFRAAFPEAWRFVLVLDTDAHGLHGPEELSAFERLPVFPAERAGHLCRLALMQLLPALTEQDLPRFGAALTELQQIIGDHFAPAQGGRFTSRRVAQALAWLEQAGATGIGQSSWGPTGFALAGDPAQAAQLAAGAEREFGGQGGLRVLATAAANHGAAVQFRDARAAPLESAAAAMARRRIGART
jgi:beta-RFAP synthase